MKKGSLISIAIMFLVSCSGDKLSRDDSGNVVKRGKENIFEVKVGDCTNEELKEEATEIALVPCTEPHTHEAYFAVDYVAAAYPGSAALEIFAEQQCVGSYADYVGVELSQSRLYFTYLYPSVTTWNSKEDRQVVCFAVARDELLIASVKDTAT